MYQPLADLLRPQTLDEVYGQEHILGKGAVLRRLIGQHPQHGVLRPQRHGKDHRCQYHRQADQPHPL